MPELNTTLHLDMFHNYKRNQNLSGRLFRAYKILFSKNSIYGLEWGDPNINTPLKYVRDHFLLPYLTSETVLIEIGPGGGRWTQYMLFVKKIYAVDYHKEILLELKRNFKNRNIELVKNNGFDFPFIPEKSIDFIFSFGTFVHLDLPIINNYLSNIKPLIRQNANVIIQYSDKTKPLGKSNEGFSDNDPQRMRSLIESYGFKILEEDTQTLCHSSIIRFGL